MDWVTKERKRLEKLRKSLSIEDYLTEIDNCLAVAQNEYETQFRSYDHFTEPPLTEIQKAAKERLSFYQSALESLKDVETAYRNTPISFHEWKEKFPIIWGGVSEQLEAEKALFLGEYTNEQYSNEYKEKVYKDALKSVKRLLKKKESKYGANPSDYYYPITGKSCYRWVNASSAARVMLFRWLYFNWLDKLPNAGKEIVEADLEKEYTSMFRFSDDAKKTWEEIKNDPKSRKANITSFCYGVSLAIVQRNKVKDGYSAEQITHLIAKRLGKDLGNVKLGKKVSNRATCEEYRMIYRAKFKW